MSRRKYKPSIRRVSQREDSRLAVLELSRSRGFQSGRTGERRRGLLSLEVPSPLYPITSCPDQPDET